MNPTRQQKGKEFYARPSVFNYKLLGKIISVDEDEYHGFCRRGIHRRRRAVLREVLQTFSQSGKTEELEKQAQANVTRWQENAEKITSKVEVFPGDWGDVVLQCEKKHGKIYAALNMANAYAPGGGYEDGMAAQEEHMWRRTNCHFYVPPEHMDQSRTLYTPELTRMIDGEDGLVYLDHKNIRVCIRGGEASDYKQLPPGDIFPFYELRSAADDLRGGHKFDSKSMYRKIKAQFQTLRERNIRHVVLSAFGCGAFGNPASSVAALYKRVIEEYKNHLDHVVFAIYHAGYGPDNFTPFRAVLVGRPQSKSPETTSENSRDRKRKL